MTTNTHTSFLQRIWEKGILQIILSYLVGAWAVLQFIDWAVNRYGISSAWTDVFLVLFLALLPSVLIYTYYHSKKANERWRRVEKIVIPTNLFFALGLTVFLFYGKSLSATSSKVSTKNEQGEIVNKMVPKSEYTRRLICFPLNSQDLEADQQWLGLATPLIQATDLQQDSRLYTPYLFYLEDDMRRYGYQVNQFIPLGIQRKIADDQYADLFINGDIKAQEGLFKLNFSVYQTDDGQVFFAQEYEGADPYSLIDQFNNDLKKAIYLKDNQSNQKYVDLPAQQLYSLNEEAIQLYIQALIKEEIDNQPEDAIVLFQQALKKDPTFALCYKELALTQFRLNNLEEGTVHLEKAMDLMDQLSEREQLNLKFQYYRGKKEIEKAIALLEMWIEFYPYDYIPYRRLIDIHRDRLAPSKAIEVGEKALANGHNKSILLTLAWIYHERGNIDQAAQYYQAFAEAYPHRLTETLQLGYIYRKQGKIKDAKAHFEKIYLLQPTDFRPIGCLAQVEGDLGNFEKSGMLYQKSLTAAKIPEDSSRVMGWMEYHYYRLGQVHKVIDLLEYRLEKVDPKFLSPYQAFRKLFWPVNFERYASIGKLREHRDRCLNIVNQHAGGDPFLTCLVEMMAHITLEDTTTNPKVLLDCRPVYDSRAGENEQKLGTAFYYRTIKEYDKAIELFEEVVEEAPEPYFKHTLASIYHEVGQYDKAQIALEEILLGEPQYPDVLVKLAQTYHKQGQVEKAKATLQQALQIWENADPDFIPAQKAKELTLEW